MLGVEQVTQTSKYTKKVRIITVFYGYMSVIFFQVAGYSEDFVNNLTFELDLERL